jgi:hypothetical protein
MMLHDFESISVVVPEYDESSRPQDDILDDISCLYEIVCMSESYPSISRGTVRDSGFAEKVAYVYSVASLKNGL